MMQTKATRRSLRMHPRKVRLLIDLVRGLPVSEALVQLQFSKKHAAKPVRKLIQSAVANARHQHQQNLQANTLKITEAFVDGGPTLGRWMPRAMGRAAPIHKRTAHVTIVLAGEVAVKASTGERQSASPPQKQDS